MCVNNKLSQRVVAVFLKKYNPISLASLGLKRKQKKKKVQKEAQNILRR